MRNLKIWMSSLSLLLIAQVSHGWEAYVTAILQHGNNAAITLSPDPGIGNCEYGSPYILIVDDTPAAQQRFSLLLTALASGKKISGYQDECSSAIWGQSRPTVRRIRLTNSN